MAKKEPEDNAEAPVTRQRQPAQNSSSDEVQDGRQKAAAERYLASRAENERAHIEQSLPIKLSQDTFVGKVASEPHLDPEIVTRKRGNIGFGPGVAHEPDVEVIDHKEHGEVVDKILVTPERAANGLPGAVPLNEVQKVQKTIEAHVGGKKDKEPSDKEKSQTLEDAQAAVAGVEH